jgi:hypothetical protein
VCVCVCVQVAYKFSLTITLAVPSKIPNHPILSFATITEMLPDLYNLFFRNTLHISANPYCVLYYKPYPLPILKQNISFNGIVIALEI